jgi:hypothetical protein
MLSRFKAGIRFANVVSLLALFVALSGGAYAAIKLPNSSVKTKSIKNGAVKTSKLADNAVSAPKLADNAVTAPKIKDGEVGSTELATSAKSRWVRTDVTGTSIERQSGGVTLAANGATSKVVDFGVSLADRGVTVTPAINLGAVDVEFSRCTEVGCAAPYANSPNAIVVFTFDGATGAGFLSGFEAVATP